MSYRYDDYEEVRTERPASPRKKSASSHKTVQTSAKSRSSASSSAKKTTQGVKKSSSAVSQSKRSASSSRSRYQDYDGYRYSTGSSSKRRSPAKKRTSRSRKKRMNPMLALLLWLLAIGLAFAASYFIKQYCFEIVRVSGDSMYQTLMDGDLVLVTKSDYNETAAQRGDIVMVELGEKKGPIIRRIVALPGETIEITTGDTYINGSKMLEQYIGLKTYDDFEGKTLPPDRYYILGDNRTEISDSRNAQIGLIDREDIVGKAKWVVWPLNHLGSL